MEEITASDFDRPTVVIRLTDLYRPRLEFERVPLYEVTRAHWSIKKDHRIPKAKIALSAHDGIVLEVYEIAAWVPANSTMMVYRMDKGGRDRMEFVGDVATNRLRSKYVGKSVAGLFKRGDIRPVAYFEGGKRKSN